MTKQLLYKGIPIDGLPLSSVLNVLYEQYHETKAMRINKYCSCTDPYPTQIRERAFCQVCGKMMDLFTEDTHSRPEVVENLPIAKVAERAGKQIVDAFAGKPTSRSMTPSFPQVSFIIGIVFIVFVVMSLILGSPFSKNP